MIINSPVTAFLTSSSDEIWVLGMREYVHITATRHQWEVFVLIMYLRPIVSNPDIHLTKMWQFSTITHFI